MIMKRFIMQDLLKWRDNPRRKPLLLTGVRQCGKTYILKEFGRQYFENVAYFNFEEDETLTSVFDHNFDVDRILDELGSVVLGKTLADAYFFFSGSGKGQSSRAAASLSAFGSEWHHDRNGKFAFARNRTCRRHYSKGSSLFCV